MLFWSALTVSLLTGIYGFLTARIVIFAPYFFINPLILIFLALLKKISIVKKLTLPAWGEQIKNLSALTLLLNVPGSVYLHRIGIQYDIFVHIASAFLSFLAVLLLTALISYYSSAKLPSMRKILIISFFITFAGGVGVEGIQKLSDALFGTRLFFDLIQPALVDFWWDILMNLSGIFIGVIFALKRFEIAKFFTAKANLPQNFGKLN